MLLNPIKVVTAWAFVGLAGGWGPWHAFAMAPQDRPRAPGSPASAKTSPPAPDGAAKPQAPLPGPPCRFRGVVRVEGTGEPVDGAKLQIMLLGDAGLSAVPNEQVVATGVDGRFAVELPPGNARVFFIEPPVGYWVPTDQKFMELLVFRPEQPLIDREYHVRKGTVWSLRFTRGAEALPHGGFVIGSNPTGLFSARADDEGRARLTLPVEGGKAKLQVREGEPLAPANTGFLTLDLEWDPDFRPDELEEVVRLDGNDRRFRLTDAGAKSATLQGPDSIEPVKENGRLVIRVALPGRGARDVSAIAGQVIDADGRPIPGVHVALAMGGLRVPSNDPWHQTTTDSRGRYRLREIPRVEIDGKPSRVALIVAKEGYVGVQSPPLSLSAGDSQKPQVIQPIRLERGVSLSGVVVDHRGHPAAGAWVRAQLLHSSWPAWRPSIGQDRRKRAIHNSRPASARGSTHGLARRDPQDQHVSRRWLAGRSAHSAPAGASRVPREYRRCGPLRPTRPLWDNLLRSSRSVRGRIIERTRSRASGARSSSSASAALDPFKGRIWRDLSQVFVSCRHRNFSFFYISIHFLIEPFERTA